MRGVCTEASAVNSTNAALDRPELDSSCCQHIRVADRTASSYSTCSVQDHWLPNRTGCNNCRVRTAVSFQPLPSSHSRGDGGSRNSFPSLLDSECSSGHLRYTALVSRLSSATRARHHVVALTVDHALHRGFSHELLSRVGHLRVTGFRDSPAYPCPQSLGSRRTGCSSGHRSPRYDSDNPDRPIR